MISEAELDAMLYLLDDTDEQVVKTVSGRLMDEGDTIIPLLEQYWVQNNDPLRARRIELIIQAIQKRSLSRTFYRWMESTERDLLQACLMVSKTHYPGQDDSTVLNFIEKMRMDAWMALYNAQTPYDKIKILNHIFFERYGFKGNNENYHSPDNSFINRVIETRSGNPISLCNLYAILAHRLGIPVFGVNLPQHFVLAYCDDTHLEPVVPFNAPEQLVRENFGKVLFYINPFSKGQIFLNRNVREFLEVIKVEPQPEFFEPCDNIEILRRMLRNLHFAYAESHDQERRLQLEHYMRITGMMRELDAGWEEGDD